MFYIEFFVKSSIYLFFFINLKAAEESNFLM